MMRPATAEAICSPADPAFPGGLFVWRIRRALERNRARRQLRAMPDYLLKDIGISRSDIDRVAVDPADTGPVAVARVPARAGD